MNRNKLSNLLTDQRLEELELRLRKPNIFYILKFQSAEIRHSNFLAWLLNPNANHGLRELFLKKFLKDIFAYRDLDWMDEFKIDATDLGSVEIRREWQHIDILIICKEFIVAIENKFLSKEHSDQLTRYRKTIEKYFKSHKSVFVFLTRYGDSPETEEDKQVWINYNYEEIARNIEIILNIYSKMLNKRVRIFLKDYLTTLRMEIMGEEDKLINLVKDIYASHKEALDFIFENKPDRLAEISYIIKNKVKQKGFVLGSISKTYIRFLTTKMDKIIPRKATEWTKRESFLFEFEITLNRISFKTSIAPGDEEVRAILIEIMEKVKGAKTPKGKKWIVHVIEGFRDGFGEMSDEEIENFVDKIFSDKLSEIINNVDEEMQDLQKLQ